MVIPSRKDPRETTARNRGQGTLKIHWPANSSNDHLQNDLTKRSVHSRSRPAGTERMEPAKIGFWRWESPARPTHVPIFSPHNSHRSYCIPAPSHAFEVPGSREPRHEFVTPSHQKRSFRLLFITSAITTFPTTSPPERHPPADISCRIIFHDHFLRPRWLLAI